MKATGIVRRIDDLGRVVIPKEIRRTMRIREGDPLEIYTDREGEVIFKKYSPIGELAGFAGEYAEALQKTSGMPIFVTDRDAVIAVAGCSKREYLERKISKDLDDLMEARTLYRYSGGEELPILQDGSTHFIGCAMPIVSEGDLIGCVFTGRQKGIDDPKPTEDSTEAKLIQTAGIFLGKQMNA